MTGNNGEPPNDPSSGDMTSTPSTPSPNNATFKVAPQILEAKTQTQTMTPSRATMGLLEVIACNVVMSPNLLNCWLWQ